MKNRKHFRFLLLTLVALVGCGPKVIHINKENRTQINALPFVYTDVQIDINNAGKTSIDTPLTSVIMRMLKQEIQETLSDKYQMLAWPTDSSIHDLIDELRTYESLVRSVDKKNVNYVNHTYNSVIDMPHRYLLLVSLRGIYNPDFDPSGQLKHSVTMSQLSGAPMMMLPTGNRHAGYLLNVYLLDNANKRIVLYNQINAAEDPRLKDYLKANIYKSLKPVYYW
jgi:hypothetical protein